MFSESWIKTTNYIPAKVNLQEATRTGTVSGLRAGRTVKEIMSCEDFSKNNFCDHKWKCCFWRICLCVYDSKISVKRWTRYMKIALTSFSKTALLTTIARGHRMGSRRTLRRCGRRRSGLPAPLTATLWTILRGASLNYGSKQSLTTKPRPLSQRSGGWWCPSPGTLWRRPASGSGPRSRLSSLLWRIFF